MRFGKKPFNKVVEVKKTRSCVVRLEKVSTPSPNVSPSPEESRILTRTNRLGSTAMGPGPKGRKGGTPSQREDRANFGTAKKKIVGTNVNSSFQTPHQLKSTNINMTNVRPNQKLKIIPRSNKATPSSTPSREETPPPTIAAGRSRRAIKPNPKYASEDMVTPKVVRNVGMLGSASSKGGTTGPSRARKTSASSDDFYNRNSEDEYDNYAKNMQNDDDEFNNDKAYQASEKDDNDSDFSEIDEAPTRSSRSRRRPKKSHETIKTITPQAVNKLPMQTPTIKRSTTTVTGNSSSLRSAPSQLQQIRRSLVSVNTQRNINLLTGSGVTSQKRKLEEIQDSSDNEINYSIKRKQLLISNSSGLKVKLPVRENRANVTSNPLTKSRLVTQTQVQKTQPQQTINGSNKINNILPNSRRTIEIAVKPNSESTVKPSLRHSASAANVNQNNKTENHNPVTTQAKILSSKTQRFRSGSPKHVLQKNRQNNGPAVSISSASSNSSLLNINNKSEKVKPFNTQSMLKPKTSITSQISTAVNSEIVNEIKDDSPNSTMDDFETMPTFTIVNVNDIINKKGDVLITKTKSNSNKTPTVIEFSESISLDDDDEEDNNNINDEIEEEEAEVSASRSKQILSKKMPKLPTLNNRNEIEKKKSPLARPNESSRKLSTHLLTSTTSSKQAPQILNHKLGLRNARITTKTSTTLTATLTSPDKPAPRILNSMVAKKTQPVKPMIANMEDSADESFPLSLDEDEDEDADEETEDELESKNTKSAHITDRLRKREYQNLMDVDTEDTESQNTEDDNALLQNINTASSKLTASKVAALGPKQNTGVQRNRRTAVTSNNPLTVSSNKKRLTPVAAKENSLAATNQQVYDTTTKQSNSALPTRKQSNEKVVISKQGDKIIKKITCFETWYVINMPTETKRPAIIKNQLEMPLIQLANQAKNIFLPSNKWSSKVTLYELSPQTLANGTFATYTGDLYEHNINEEDRGKYQPSCVMFRRSIEKTQISRMPYDRAVIFKNKTFYTNIEGKNIRLLGAPSIINSESEIEILLKIMDNLTLQSDFVEHISILQ